MVLNQSTELHDDSDAPCDKIADPTIPRPEHPQSVVNPQPVETPPLVQSPGLHMNATHVEISDIASMLGQNESALVRDESALIEDESALIEDESALIQDESALIQDESALIQDETGLIQDLAMAHTADMRRYVLGKSVQVSACWANALLQYCCEHVMLALMRRASHDFSLGLRLNPPKPHTK